MLSFMFSESRQLVLGLLLLQPNKHFHVREIARLTHTSAGSLHRELVKLANAEVLIREESGHQVYYRANTSFLLYKELVSILQKTSGIAHILTKALTPLKEKIEVAFIFGSIGRGTENANSDVDVLIIGKISFTEAVTALYSTQEEIGREINPKVYSHVEWQKLVKKKDAFISQVMSDEKIFIIGESNDLR